MTKQELLDDLATKSFIAFVATPEVMLLSTGEPEIKPDGGKVYVVNVKEVVGNSAVYRNIFFYVVDEGKATESAYYKDSEPAQTLKEVEVVA